MMGHRLDWGRNKMVAIHKEPIMHSLDFYWGKEVYWFHSVRLSVRPASRVRSVASTVLVGFISYSYILSSYFRRFVACNFFQNFLKTWNFDFVFLWLWISCESLEWVIMGRGGISQNAGVLIILICIVGLKELLNKQPSCQWFEIPWRSRDVILMSDR